MKAWEIYSYQHPDWPEPHPAVIVSHPARVALKPAVTILLCSSKPAARPAKPHEVIPIMDEIGTSVEGTRPTRGRFCGGVGRVPHPAGIDRAIMRIAEPHEVMLDSSDGLDWPTVCKGDLLYTLPKTALTKQRGTVTAERRRQIVATINRAMGWV